MIVYAKLYTVYIIFKIKSKESMNLTLLVEFISETNHRRVANPPLIKQQEWGTLASPERKALFYLKENRRERRREKKI